MQWTRAKGFDTFAPFGPWIVTDIVPDALDIETYLNGTQKQRSNTRQLLFDPLHLVTFVSRVMTLNPGDVIASGTPAGIGPMEAGDRVEIRIQGIGSLVNEVASWEKGPTGP
jgi:2-keto-4-pentenoate hydratase/2-oxohepta-3-ene-1,7-dioic acid hydratase in catechol pathway